MKSTVKVAVRTRPTASFAHSELVVRPEAKSIDVNVKKNPSMGIVNNMKETYNFKFDTILHNSSQDTVYNECVSEIVQKCFPLPPPPFAPIIPPPDPSPFLPTTPPRSRHTAIPPLPTNHVRLQETDRRSPFSHSVVTGYNGSVLVYGQTGAGKTYTMSGGQGNYKTRGCIPRSIQEIFTEVQKKPQQVCPSTASPTSYTPPQPLPSSLELLLVLDVTERSIESHTPLLFHLQEGPRGRPPNASTPPYDNLLLRRPSQSV